MEGWPTKTNVTRKSEKRVGKALLLEKGKRSHCFCQNLTNVIPGVLRLLKDGKIVTQGKGGRGDLFNRGGWKKKTESLLYAEL